MIAWEAMHEAERAGRAEEAVTASRHIQDMNLRLQRLREGGHWRELTAVTPVSGSGSLPGGMHVQ
jgi:hypothetical protein